MSVEQPIIPSAAPAAPTMTMSRIGGSSSSPLPTQTTTTFSIMVSPSSLNSRPVSSRPSSTTSSTSSGNPLNPSTQSLNNIPTFVPSVSLDLQSTDDSLQSPSPLINTPDGTSPEPQPSSPGSNGDDVDPQILEALKSKDRLYVLKLGEVMEGIINDRSKGRADLTPATSYQRLLVHRCSSYYKLSPESDSSTKAIIVSLTTESRIPPRRLCELVPVELTAQPTFKIMRRSAPNRNKSQSQAGSVAGEDADLSDVEASETGSMGGRSNATGGSNKKRMTIEEREAAYNEARSRIFMDFDDNEKDKDMSAAGSSTLSLVSGSSSASATGGGSSIGDFDDFVSTETESEWSAPVTRERKEGKRGTSSSASSSSRSLRPSAPSFNANGSSSSRGSRAPSPSFTYATLYEPAPAAAYDASQQAPQPQPQPMMGPPYPAPYVYPYGQPPPNQGFVPSGYQYYPPYPYPQMPPPQQNNGEGSTSSEMYSPAPVPYGQPFWQPPAPGHGMSPTGQYPPPFIPGQQYSYPVHGGYYPAPLPPPGPPIAQPMYSPDMSRGNGFNSSGSGSQSRASSRNSAGSNGSKRAPSNGRAPWSYGPSPSMGGYTFNGPSSGDTVGPRLSSNTRRASGHSSGSSGHHKSTHGDEASSTASSSTTSSSSRRTYTSNTSSQHHPLPPRPDWAVNLKPQVPSNPRNDHVPIGGHSVGSMSPSRDVLQRQPQRHMSPALQSNDFPPLAGVSAAPEKRVPAGAWTNSSRSILMPNQNQGQVHPPGNALVQQHNNNNHFVPHLGMHNHGGLNLNNSGNLNGNTRHDDTDRGFERPPPKPAAELFNPKVVRRPMAGNSNGSVKIPAGEDRDRERMRGETVASAILVSQYESMSLEPAAGKVEGVPKESQNGSEAFLEATAA